jgi:di/tricarboxylate transporter
MARVVVRSRSGNVVLTVLGAIYALGAAAAFVAFVVDVWAAAGMIDRALLIGLVAAAVCGIWLLVTGLENLGVHRGKGLPHFPHRSSGSH